VTVGTREFGEETEERRTESFASAVVVFCNARMWRMKRGRRVATSRRV
jgi:hypothetical protein